MMKIYHQREETDSSPVQREREQTVVCVSVDGDGSK